MGSPRIPGWSSRLRSRYNHNAVHSVSQRSTRNRRDLLGMSPRVRGHPKQPTSLPCLSHQLRRPWLWDWSYRYCMERMGEWHPSTKCCLWLSPRIVFSWLCGRPCNRHICAPDRRDLGHVLHGTCTCLWNGTYPPR
jgi:hypothetical protein